jgi:formaldehyde-activating enzyme involved in methanogenesis
MRPFWEYSEAGVVWGIPISIWAKWICDETEKEYKVFENDWEITKDRLLKNIKNNPDDEKLLKETIKPY